MNVDARQEQESQLIAELANATMSATNKGRLSWEKLCTDQSRDQLRVTLVGGYARLGKMVGEDTVRFTVFSVTDELVGFVNDNHPTLRYDMRKCLVKLTERCDPGLRKHRAHVTILSGMFGQVQALLTDDSPEEIAEGAESEADAAMAMRNEADADEDVSPLLEAAMGRKNEIKPWDRPPDYHRVGDPNADHPDEVVEEDQIEELAAEDEAFIFQADQAELAAEMTQDARQQAGTEEEPLATLPGMPPPAPPAPAAPGQPAVKKTKLVRRLKKRSPGATGGTGVLDR